MEPVIDPTVIDVLTGGADGRSWIVLVGAILVGVVAVVRFVTEGVVPEVAARWISAVGGCLAAVGISYMSGIGSWIDGALIGLLATPATRGLLLAVRDGIRWLVERRKKS